MKKNQLYVVRCIKGNNNKFGFGHRHKIRQYISYTGKGVSDINEAYVYKNQPEDYCPLEELDGYEEYYEFVPVKITISKA